MRVEPGAHFRRANRGVAPSLRTRDECKRLSETEASRFTSRRHNPFGVGMSVIYLPICSSPSSPVAVLTATLGFGPQPHLGLILYGLLLPPQETPQIFPAPRQSTRW